MPQNSFRLYQNPDGPVLGTVSAPILEQDGLFFKDLARTGQLLPYEDWRLPAQTRAEDLAARLSIEESAGLMMYSPHQMIPTLPGDPFQGSYNGKPFPESDLERWALTDQQKAFLEQDHIRHVLVMKLESAGIAARWSNAIQQAAEELPWGIPVNVSSDPRHGASKAKAEFKSGANDVSKWPEGLGIAATFSPEQTCTRGEIITLLWRFRGSPEPGFTGSAYGDVTDPDSYYYKACQWAAEQGMAKGDTFAPNDPCTRAMAVEFLWYANQCPRSDTGSGFADVPAGASYADAVTWAVNWGVTQGTGEGTFSPDLTCTRGQIVTFLFRAIW